MGLLGSEASFCFCFFNYKMTLPFAKCLKNHLSHKFRCSNLIEYWIQLSEYKNQFSHKNRNLHNWHLNAGIGVHNIIFFVQISIAYFSSIEAQLNESFENVKHRFESLSSCVKNPFRKVYNCSELVCNATISTWNKKLPKQTIAKVCKMNEIMFFTLRAG